MILAKTIKGWTLGPGFEGRNATHQLKKMTKEQLLEMRERLHLEDEIPEASLDGPAVLQAGRTSEHASTSCSDGDSSGALPQRIVRTRRPLTLPLETPFASRRVRGRLGQRRVSTTMVFTGLLRSLVRDHEFG